MKHFNIKKYMNEEIDILTAIMIISTTVSVGIISILAFFFDISEVPWYAWIIILFLPVTLITIKFHKLIYILLHTTFKFLISNIFYICICLSILYIGNRMIDKIAITIEKNSNIVPVATHNGFAIYNRAEDKFFEYKKDKYDSEKYDVNVYTPSYKLEKIHREYYKK